MNMYHFLRMFACLISLSGPVDCLHAIGYDRHRRMASG